MAEAQRIATQISTMDQMEASQSDQAGSRKERSLSFGMR